MFVWVSVHVYGDQSLLSCLVSVASLPWGFCLHFPALGLQITTIPSSLYMDSGALNSGLHACMAITSSTKTTDDFNISIYCYIVQKAKKNIFNEETTFQSFVTKFIKSFAFEEQSQLSFIQLLFIVVIFCETIQQISSTFSHNSPMELPFHYQR